MAGEKKSGMSLLPPAVTLFFCQVIAFTPVGDLGRFNHTISSSGQLNQIGQINSSYTGEGFTFCFAPFFSGCPPCVLLCVCSHKHASSCRPARLSWHAAVLAKLNSQFSRGGLISAKRKSILNIISDHSKSFTSNPEVQTLYY